MLDNTQCPKCELNPCRCYAESDPNCVLCNGRGFNYAGRTDPFLGRATNPCVCMTKEEDCLKGLGADVYRDDLLKLWAKLSVFSDGASYELTRCIERYLGMSFEQVYEASSAITASEVK